jgi:hypothetical protein
VINCEDALGQLPVSDCSRLWLSRHQFAPYQRGRRASSIRPRRARAPYQNSHLTAIWAWASGSWRLGITESFDEGGFEAVNIEHFRSDGEGDGPRPGGSGRMAFFLRCVGNATISEPYASIVKSRQLIRELVMRALIVCAIVITAAVGLGGCFHHAQAVTQQPLKLG